MPKKFSIAQLLFKRYKSKGRAHKFIPRVKDTHNISQRTINLEGLLAGYKPLFLGKGSSNLDSESNDNLRYIYEDGIYSKSSDKSVADNTITIPWDASIGGLIHSDQSFKNVPKEQIKSLSFFQAPSNPQNIPRPKYIQFKVHNEIVDGGLFDDYQEGRKMKVAKNKVSKTYPLTPMTKKEQPFVNLAFSNELSAEFIHEKELLLQYTIDNFKNKLNDDLKMKHGTVLLSQTPLYKLPRYIFIQRKTIANELFLKRKLYKIFLDETAILLRMINGYKTSEYNKMRKKRSYMRGITALVNTLCKKIYVPVDTFKNADALILKIENNSFGRIYWFNQKRRYDLVVRSSPFVAVHRRKQCVVKGPIGVPVELSCRIGREESKTESRVAGKSEDISSALSDEKR